MLGNSVIRLGRKTHRSIVAPLLRQKKNTGPCCSKLQHRLLSKTRMSVRSTGMAKVLTTFLVKDEYLNTFTRTPGCRRTWFCKQMRPKTNKNHPTVVGRTEIRSNHIKKEYFSLLIQGCYLNCAVNYGSRPSSSWPPLTILVSIQLTYTTSVKALYFLRPYGNK